MEAHSPLLHFIHLAAGSHTIDVKDANGCIFSTSASINNTGAATAIATTIADATCGDANGSITLGAVTGGTAPYTYSVDGRTFTSTTLYSGLAAGSHTIDVKDANGCTFSTSASINNTSAATAIATTIADATCGDANGSITLGAVTGGTAPYTYSVDGSTFTSTTLYSGLAAGSHTIDVKDANGCTFSTSASINNTGAATAIATTIADATCGDANGSITLGAVTGGTAPYTYSVDGSTFTSTTLYSGLSAGSHTIDVKDANGCTFSTSASINNTGAATAIATTIADATCGDANGSITLGAVTGGTAPYTYSVDGSTFTSTTLYSGLSAGSHTIDVKDANGCTFSTSASINNTGAATAIATTIADATCGDANGSITLGAVTGGTAPYTYSVDGSTFTSTTLYSGLSAGSHTIDVKDANGCTFSTSASINNTGAATAIATTIADATCGDANGSITLGAVTGGTAPYTYSVDGSTFTSTTLYSGLSAGSHTIDVKDANGCTFSTSASINNTGAATAIATTIADATCGDANGSITLGAVTGGTAPYTYSVDGSTFTSTTLYSGLSAGSHTIDVKDANGCTFSTSASINNTGAATAIATTIADATCGDANGSITLGAVTGGTAPYTYSVDGSTFTSTTLYSGLSAGSHTIDVKDANGCTFSTSASINNTGAATAIATTIADATCGDANGSITLGAVTGGTAPYTYSVDGSTFTSTTLYSGLSAGSHTIDVKDASGCTFSTSASINNTGAATAIATTIADATCGDANGSITLGAVTGGTAPYTYSVDGSTFTSTTLYSGLSAGSHTIDVKDANGCTFSTSASINNTGAATAIATTIADATCGDANGSITLGAVTGGTAPYTYSVDGSTFTSTTLYSGLSAGSHTIDVKDASGCTFSTSASINNTGAATAIATTIADATCGDANGSITLGAVTGGTAPYTYSVDGSTFTSTTLYSGLSAGSHTIDVKDASGCTFSTSASINNTGAATAIATTIADATCGDANGSITLGAVTGGTAPYTYSVDGSTFTSTTLYSGLSAGSHTIDVKDANGCTFSTSASINNTGAATAIATTIADATCGDANGSITLGAVTGGTAPYTYSVDGSTFTSTTLYSGLSAGSHTIDVKDANGCTFSTSASINNTGAATAIATTIADATCGDANGSITLGAVTGGTAPYTYSVDGSTFTSTTLYSGLSAGSHTIDVKDANGCTFSTSASINNTGAATAIATTIADATCGDANGSITLGAVTGGTAPYTYSVDGSTFTSTTLYSGLSAGSHTIDVKDANGCTFSTSASINNTGAATAIATTIADATCGDANGSITLGAVTGGTAPYTYSVDGSTFTSTTLYSGLSAGSHTIDVKDANGCTFSTSASINNTGAATAIATTIADATCGDANGSITLGAVTGGTAPYTYSVDGSTFTSTTLYSGLSAGSHTIDVKDANGCTFSTSASINNTGAATAIATTIADATCGDANGSITLGAVTGGTAPYTYSVDGSTFTSTTLYSGLSAGSHTIDVKDANGCTFSTSASINNTGAATAIATTIADATCGDANGSITLGAVTGGTAPYTYSVDGSTFTSTTLYSGLSAGSHTIDVKDASGCTFSTSASINNTGAATAIATTIADATCGDANGSITLGAVTGGTAPYTYSVDGRPYDVTLYYPNLPAGTHTIDVRDASGCIFSTSANINQPPVTTAAISGNAIICVGSLTNLTVTLTGTGPMVNNIH